jgi:hypothetical protein
MGYEIFLRLLLGHFLGDFPLQTDFTYRLKLKYRFGILLHIGIIAICCIILLYPYLGYSIVWVSIFLILLTHLLQDKIKLKIYNSYDNILIFFIDQILHILIIYGVSALIAHNIDNDKLIHLPNGLNKLYWNNKIVILAILYCIVSYFSYILIMYIKKAIKKMNELELSNALVKYVGILERILISTSIFTSNVILFIIGIIMNLGMLKLKKIEVLDSFLSITISIVIGIVMKIFI